ncbi:MAG: FeoA family protein [Lachnospiraceae bacterium]
MNLKEGYNHHMYRVDNIHMELQLERRLEALGLTEGTTILILNNDKNGSLTVKFRGTRFAFGKEIAEHIFVTEVIDHE